MAASSVPLEFGRSGVVILVVVQWCRCVSDSRKQRWGLFGPEVNDVMQAILQVV